MRKSRYTEEQIFGLIKQADAGVNVAELCRKEGFSTATFYKWRAKFGGMEASDAKRLRELEGENAKLKKLLAEAVLDNRRAGRLPMSRRSRWRRSRPWPARSKMSAPSRSGATPWAAGRGSQRHA